MSRFVVRPARRLGFFSLAVWGAQSCLAPGSLDEERLRFHSQAAAEAGRSEGDGGPAAAAGCVAACTTFRTTCATSGCHSAADPASGLDLQSAGVVARLSGARARSGACANQSLLVPGDAAKSLVYTKLLQTPACGIRMPLTGMLSQGDIDCVRRWALSPSCPEETAGAGGTNNGGGMNGTGGTNGSGGNMSIGGTNSTGGANDAGGAPRDAGKPSAPIHIEAESGSLTAPMVVAMDGAASGGKYIAAPGAAKNQDPTASTMGVATYMFDVATAGVYTIYGRVEAQSQATDSFWVKVDGATFIQWNNISNPMSTTWTWEAVHDTNKGDAVVPFTLNAGKHTLLIAYREPDTRLDALSISNDPGYTPMGTDQ